MTKFFSFKLFTDGLSKTKVFGILSIILTTVLSTFMSVTTVINATEYRNVEFIEASLFSPFLLMMLLLAPFSVYMQFSFLNKRASSDFYHSLPFTRLQLCISFFASIVLWVIAAMVIPIALNSVIYAVCPYTGFDLATPFLCFIGYFGASLLLMSLMFMAMSLTGTVVSNILVFGIITLFFRIVFLIITLVFEELLPIVHSDLLFGSYLNYDFFLPFHCLIMDDLFEAPAPIIYAYAISILCIIGGVFLFNRRKSETADKSAVSRVFQNIFRCAVSLPTAILFVVFLFEGLFSPSDAFEQAFTTVLFLLVTLIVYFLYEIITQKGVATLKKSIPQIFLVFGIAAATYGGIKLTEQSILSYSPSAEEIKSVQLYVNFDHRVSYEDIKTANIEINNKDAINLVAQSLDNSIEACRNGKYWRGNNITTSLYINDNKGNKKLRRLILEETNYELLVESFNISNEYNEAQLLIPTDSEIDFVGCSFGTGYVHSEYNINDLWSCFSEEYNSLSPEEKLAVKYPSDSIFANLDVNGTCDGISFSSYYYIGESMPKTLDMIMSLYHSEDDASAIKKTCDSLLNSDTDYYYIFADVNAFDLANSESLGFTIHFDESDGDYQLENLKTLINTLSPYYDNLPTEGDYVVSLTIYTDSKDEYGESTLVFSVPEEAYKALIPFISVME